MKYLYWRLQKWKNHLQNFYNRLVNSYILYINEVVYDKGLKITGRIYVESGDKHINIGKNVTINSSIEANPTGGTKTRLCTNGSGMINIGNGVGISNAIIFAFEIICIEDNVMIGAGTRIYDSDFHATLYRERMNNDSAKSKPVILREGCFIGAGSTILKGVSIGKRSVVGACSVVTHDIPDDEMWGGNPAKFIRKINN